MSSPAVWGNEFLVNTTTYATQSLPKIAALANGRFVAVWSDWSATGGDTSESAIRAQMFNADGTKFGGELLVNTATTFFQDVPAVTALPNGKFAITWMDTSRSGGDPDSSAVRCQMYNGDGTRYGAEFLVNTATANQQYDPAMASFGSGRFIVTWSDLSGVGDASQQGVKAQLFNSDGSPYGIEFLVNSTTNRAQVQSTVAVLADSNFVAAWYDLSQAGPDTSGSAIRARLFNSAGIPFAPDFVVNTTTAGDQNMPKVAALKDGGFVVTWTDGLNTQDSSIRAQLFNADATPRGSEILVNTTTEDLQLEQAVAALPDGGFVVSWSDTSDHFISDVRAQVFTATGAKAGSEFVAHAVRADYQSHPALTVLPDGRFVITFEDTSKQFGDLSESAIVAQIFDPRTGAVGLTGGALDDQFFGTSFDDALVGGAGNDWLIGGAGNDTLSGGPGADRLDGGPGIDTASYVTSTSGVIVNLGGASLLGDAAGDLIINIENVYGSEYRDILIGDLNDNILLGLGGDDVIDGGAGNDRLYGGEGANELIGGAGDDTAVFGGKLEDYGVVDMGQKIVVNSLSSYDTLTGIEHLQFADGRVDVDDGSVLFDSVFYARQNPDVYHAGANAFDHFNTFGWREGRDPNSFFDTGGYRAINRDVISNPLDHYHQHGWREGRDPSAYFDTTLYLIHNPDVAAAGVDPLEHYLAYGFSEGRVTYDAIGTHITGGFDAEYYLFHNPDVAAAGVDPLQHFNTFGWHEGRNPNGWFDTAGYLAHYADVAAAGVNPLQHYEQFGWREGRDPSAYFDTLGYLAKNADVAAAHANPLDHYLIFGIYEDRQIVNDGLWH
jgi:Ca2+-binding RTX toxin-like protein